MDYSIFAEGIIYEKANIRLREECRHVTCLKKLLDKESMFYKSLKKFQNILAK